MQIPSRAEAVATFREQGGRIAAVFPIHAPRAVFRTFGLLPVECWGPPVADTSPGDAHLPPYTCSIVRCGLSALLSGTLDAASVVMVPHACDSLQGLGSLLLDFVPPGDRPVIPFYLPRGDGEAAVDFLAKEIRATVEALARLTGTHPSEDDLAEAVAREEAADAVFDRLLEARTDLALPDPDYYRLVRSREYLPAERFTSVVEAALDPADAPEAPTATDRTGLLLSGLVAEPAALLDVIWSAGGSVVADDLAASGRRRYRPGTSADPCRRVAESLLSAAPCTTRGASMDRRVEHLLDLCRRRRARGAIFYTLKFCEPEQFYVPVERKALEAAGIKALALEGDLHGDLPSQVTTRVQALLETLA